MTVRKVSRVNPVSDKPPVLLTEVEAAKVLGLSRQTLSEWRYKKKGLSFIKLGSSIRYDMRDINAYIAKNKQEIRIEA